MNDMPMEATITTVADLPYTLAVLPVGDIHPDTSNVRSVKPDAEKRAALQASMATVGLLVPIDVYPATAGAWAIHDGEERWTVAQALGWTTIACKAWEARPTHGVASQAALNMSRADMHEVDQWLALKRAREDGMTMEQAAAAIGIRASRIGRINKLGSMHQYLLDAMRGPAGVPSDQYLRKIALAPVEVQLSAWEAATKGGKKELQSWDTLAQGCNLKRIPRAWAEFDVETAGVAFERDFFAEPGSEDEWTTADNKGFMRAQQAALEAEVAASKGRMVLGGWSEKNFQAVVPKGYRRTWGEVPKRFKKDDPRKVLVYIRGDYRFGEVHRELITAVEESPAKRAEGEPAVDSGRELDATPVKARDPITKAGQHMIAMAKMEAVQTRLREFTPPLTQVVPLLVLALSGANVSVVNDPLRSYSKASFNDLVHRLVDSEGVVRDLSGTEIAAIAAEAVARMVVFRSPNSSVSSGPVAEWIGVDVDAADSMSRFDTEEFLKTASTDVLNKAAEELGIKPHATAASTRKLLVGHAEKWIPPFAAFGAPGPADVEGDADEDEADEAVAEDEAEKTEGDEC